jgi:excinuclease UvrABC ATPase subunit
MGTDAVVDAVFRSFPSAPVQVVAPIVREKKGTYEKLVEDLAKKGYSRFVVDGFSYTAGDKLELDKQKKHTIEVVVDRLAALAENQSRIADAVETASGLANGLVIIRSGKTEKSFSRKLACDEHEVSFDELQPRMFSFNSPFGACEGCHGIGYKQEFDPELIVPDKTLSILKGAIALPGFGTLSGWRGQQLAAVARHFGFSLNIPWNQLSKSHQKIVLHGSDEDIKFEYRSQNTDSAFSGTNKFEGVIPMQKRLYMETKWGANPPARIRSLIEQKLVVAHEVQDTLQKLFARQHEQDFEVYQGADQFVANELQMIEEAEKDSFIDIIGGEGDRFAELLGESRELYNEKSIGKNIAVRFIGTHEQKEYLQATRGSRPHFDFRIMPGFNKSTVSTSIYPKSVQFQIYGEPVLVFKIRSADIARDYRTFFESLWNVCEKEG